MRMNGPQLHAPIYTMLTKRSQEQEHILYDFIYIKFKTKKQAKLNYDVTSQGSGSADGDERQ